MYTNLVIRTYVYRLVSELSTQKYVRVSLSEFSLDSIDDRLVEFLKSQHYIVLLRATFSCELSFENFCGALSTRIRSCPVV